MALTNSGFSFHFPGTYVHRPSVLHPRGDERAPAGVNAVPLVGQPSLQELAVHVNGHYVALHRNAQLVPLTIKEGVEVTALERVAEGVLQQAQEGELHRPFAPVHHNRQLQPRADTEDFCMRIAMFWK